VRPLHLSRDTIHNLTVFTRSWELIAAAFQEPTGRLTRPGFVGFLTDPYFHYLLRAPNKTFETPTAQSKADFETKTAAINVTPTPNDQYDIKEIKEDALWLSNIVNISEVAALRIAIIELQSRARSHLCTILSSQDVANIKDAAGAGGTTASTVLAIADSSAVEADTIWADFESSNGRRSRLLAIYLSERRSFAMTADYCLAFMMTAKPTAPKSPLEQLQAAAAKAFLQTPNRPTFHYIQLLPVYLDYLRGCLGLASGPNQEMVKSASLLAEDFELQWTRTCLTEAIHAMTVVFQLLWMARLNFAPPVIVSKWFNIMATYGFLDSLSASSRMH
jgi:nuclear pore complex protein Nup188